MEGVARSRIQNDERERGGLPGRRRRGCVGGYATAHPRRRPFFLLSLSSPASRFLHPCLPLDTATDNYALIAYPSPSLPPPAFSIRVFSSLCVYIYIYIYIYVRINPLVSVPVFPLLCPEPTVPHVRDTQWHIWC